AAEDHSAQDSGSCESTTEPPDNRQQPQRHQPDAAVTGSLASILTPKSRHSKPASLADDDDSPEFRLFDRQSFESLLRRELEYQRRVEERRLNAGEGRLIKFDDDPDAEEDKAKASPELADGCVLPSRFGDFPDELLAKPIQEIDRHIRKRSFVVVNTRFRRKYIYRFSANEAFYCMPPWNPIRKFFVYLATNQFVDYIIMLTILANCVCLALPNDVSVAEYVFLSVYTLEFIIKLCARGLVMDSYTYLRDPWNWLDVVVLLISYVMLILQNVSLSNNVSVGSLRTFRVFRVLKKLQFFQQYNKKQLEPQNWPTLSGMKTIISALLSSFRMLMEVIILTMFCMSVFSLVGLQVYMGVLRNKCVLSVDWSGFNSSDSLPDNGTELSAPPVLRELGGQRHQLAVRWRRRLRALRGNVSGSGQCHNAAPGYVCLADRGFESQLGIHQLRQLWLVAAVYFPADYAGLLGELIIRASGTWNIIFFIIIVFFGSFYLINLMLAVVTMRYEEQALEDVKALERENQDKKRRAKQRQKTDYKFDPQKLKRKRRKTKHVPSAKVEDAAGAADAAEGASGAAEAEGSSVEAKVGANYESQAADHPTEPAGPPPTGAPARVWSEETSAEGPAAVKAGEESTASLRQQRQLEQLKRMQTRETIDSLARTDSHADLGDAGNAQRRRWSRLEVPRGPLLSSGPGFCGSVSLIRSLTACCHAEPHGDKGALEATEADALHDRDKEAEGPAGDGDTAESQGPVDRNCPCCASCCHNYICWLQFQNKLYTFAMDPFFELFITCCIMLNTLFMATEHYPMDKTYELVLDTTNYIFTGIFTFEAVIKITAMSRQYFQSGWNVFDLIVVIASLVDVGVEGIKGLSIFRTFRLFRVFRLAQSWETMRKLLVIIFSALGAVGNLSFVLFIIVFIFAIIGMELFQGSYNAEVFGSASDVPRWNFEDFGHSMLMVFRILCGEWIEALWDCMRARGELCVVVFIPSLILGHFMVLNLFLALLLNSFSNEKLAKDDQDKEESSKFAVVKQRLSRLLAAACRPCLRLKCCLCGLAAAAEEPQESQVVACNGEVGAGNGEVGAGNGEVGAGNGEVGAGNGEVGAGNGSREQLVGSGSVITVAEATAAVEQRPAKAGEGAVPEEAPIENGGADAETRPVAEAEAADSVEPEGAAAADLTEPAAATEEDEEAKEELEKLRLHDCCCEPCYSPCRPGTHLACFRCSTDTAYGRRWTFMRQTMLRVTEHKVFEGIVMVLIMGSSISLCFEDVYIDEKPTTKLVLKYLNICFTVLFAIEMVLKQIALGLKRYFSQFWTFLDFFIVTISIADVMSDAVVGNGSNLGALRVLRALRAFRPLRTISRWEGMKVRITEFLELQAFIASRILHKIRAILLILAISSAIFKTLLKRVQYTEIFFPIPGPQIVVNCLMKAIPSIGNVLLVCMVFWLIFSITGIQFFKGKFYKCVDSDGNRLPAELVPDKKTCLNNTELGYQWRNSLIHFDNAMMSLVALFQVATFEGWMEVMRDAIDMTDIDLQPKRENSMVYYLYFVIFIVVGSFFILNLFIGVIIDNFNNLKKKKENILEVFLTPSQKSYYNTMRKLGKKKPTKTIRRPKLIIVVLIFLNMAAMMIEHDKQPKIIGQCLEVVNLMFTTIFTLEAVVKLIGLRWHYFKSPWNIYDFVIVILSLRRVQTGTRRGAQRGHEQRGDHADPAAHRPRVPHWPSPPLIKAAKGIRKLLFALIISLPALFNIGALLLLIVFIYAIVGMSLFGNAPLNDVVNFETFDRNHGAAVPPDHQRGLERHPVLADGHPAELQQHPRGAKWRRQGGQQRKLLLALIYMTTFVLVNFLIVINLYIAIILENFNQAHEQEEVGITDDDFDMFYIVWERYDPHATQYIRYDQLSDFVAELDEPLGIPKPNIIALTSFDIVIVEGDMLHCLDILVALVRNVLGSIEDSGEFRDTMAEMEKKFRETFPTRVRTVAISTTLRRKKEDIAAKTLQRAWRRQKTQRAFRHATENALALQGRNHPLHMGSSISVRPSPRPSNQCLGSLAKLPCQILVLKAFDRVHLAAQHGPLGPYLPEVATELGFEEFCNRDGIFGFCNSGGTAGAAISAWAGGGGRPKARLQPNSLAGPGGGCEFAPGLADPMYRYCAGRCHCRQASGPPFDIRFELAKESASRIYCRLTVETQDTAEPASADEASASTAELTVAVQLWVCHADCGRVQLAEEEGEASGGGYVRLRM
uniref:Sodium channel protein n=1 Tax=Macrostomum lignano TaxID=282301 RepID=A0A1I8IWT3_9PLAT